VSDNGSSSSRVVGSLLCGTAGCKAASGNEGTSELAGRKDFEDPVGLADADVISSPQKKFEYWSEER
jgi:hypothetical protein